MPDLPTPQTNMFAGTNVGQMPTPNLSVPSASNSSIDTSGSPNLFSSIGNFFSNAYNRGNQELYNPVGVLAPRGGYPSSNGPVSTPVPATLPPPNDSKGNPTIFGSQVSVPQTTAPNTVASGSSVPAVAPLSSFITSPTTTQGGGVATADSQNNVAGPTSFNVDTSGTTFQGDRASL